MATEHVHRWVYYDGRDRMEETLRPARLADLRPEDMASPHPYDPPHRQCVGGCHLIEWAVPAITVQQPWAACIALGAKGVELRSRPTRWRGPLAIHAGTRWSERGAADPRIRDRLDAGPGYPTDFRVKRDDLAASPDPECAFGAVIALTTLTDCHPAAECCPPWGDDTYDGKPVHHLVLGGLRPVNIPPRMPGWLGVWVAYLPWPVTDEHECTSCGEEYADPLPGEAGMDGEGYCARPGCTVSPAAAEVPSGVSDDGG